MYSDKDRAFRSAVRHYASQVSSLVRLKPAPVKPETDIADQGIFGALAKHWLSCQCVEAEYLQRRDIESQDITRRSLPV